MTNTTNTTPHETTTPMTFMVPNNIDNEITIDLLDQNTDETHTKLRELIGWLPNDILSKIDSILPHEKTALYTPINNESRNSAPSVAYEDTNIQKILWQLFEEIMPYDMYTNNDAYTNDVIRTMNSKEQVTFGTIGAHGFFVCVPQKMHNAETNIIRIPNTRARTNEKIIAVAIMHVTPEGNRVYINEYIEKIGNLWHSYPVSNDETFQRTITLPTPATH